MEVQHETPKCQTDRNISIYSPTETEFETKFATIDKHHIVTRSL